MLVPNFTLSVSSGHRYALLGRNGAGKTSLFNKLFAGDIAGFPQYLKVSYLRQENELQWPDKTAVDYCIAAVGEARLEALEEEQKHLEAQLEELMADDSSGQWNVEAISERLGEIDELQEDFTSERLTERAKQVLKGLGFQKSHLQTPASALSGGWRMRLALGAALVEKPDILLLDEPTNHLDLHGVLWLETFLTSTEAPRTMIVISHDRVFVDRVCTDVVVMENQTLRYFSGTFSEFEQTEDDKAMRHAHLLDGRVRQEKKAKAAADQMRRAAQSDDNLLKQAKQKEKKIERIGLYRDDSKRYKLNSIKKLDEKWIRLPQHVEAKGLERAERFTFPEPAPLRSVCSLDDPVLRLYEATCGYAAQAVLSGLNLQVSRASRVAVVGNNGAGKSTLLRTLLGDLEPLEGGRWAHGHVRVAAVHQHHTQQLEGRLELSATAFLREKFGCATDLEARTRLGRFGITGPVALAPMRSLSGGQLVRVSLTALTWGDPHVLIVDEPTNHLDVYAIDALAQALHEFKGGALCVSHNRAFLAAFCRDLWVVGDRTVAVQHGEDEPFAALFSSYEAQVMQQVGVGLSKGQQYSQEVSRAAKSLGSKGKTRAGTKGSVARSALL